SLRLLRPPISTLFPYTTLFRSGCGVYPRPLVRCYIFSVLYMFQSMRYQEPYIPELSRANKHYTSAEYSSSTEKKRSRLASSISRSEEHTSELQSLAYLVCRLLL